MGRRPKRGIRRRRDPVYAVAVGRLPFALLPLLAALLLAPSAGGSSWLPHPKGATWTYSWVDSEYSPTPTREKVTVKEQRGDAFTLAWTTDGLQNPTDAVVSAGTVSFQQ